jgi:hypothetical protein
MKSCTATGKEEIFYMIFALNSENEELNTNKLIPKLMQEYNISRN